MTERTLIEADICIIGAGSGGLSLAAGAAQWAPKQCFSKKAIWVAIA